MTPDASAIRAPGLRNGPPGERAVLRVEGLEKTYGSGSTAVQALGGISFDVAPGEFLCVVGPSGCGKTTLLKIIGGLLPASSGSVLLDGQTVDGPPEGMAMMFQDYSRSLFPWLTVGSNVAFPLRRLRLGRDEMRRRVSTSLSSVGLSGSEDQYPWQLSGGMQQRVAIARSVAYQPRILLMDEPFASVDAQTRGDLEDLMLTVRERHEMTVLFVTHDIDESVYLGDRVVILSPRPTVVKESLPVDLPRPRDQVDTKELQRFAELRAHVYRTVRRERSVDPADPPNPAGSATG